MYSPVSAWNFGLTSGGHSAPQPKHLTSIIAGFEASFIARWLIFTSTSYSVAFPMSFSSRFRLRILREWEEEEVKASKTFDNELGFMYEKRLIVSTMPLLCIKGILMLTGTNGDAKFRGQSSQENQRGTYFGRSPNVHRGAGSSAVR